MKSKVWYTLEKHHVLWTIWKNVEGHGLGCTGIYTSEKKKDFLDYAEENGIKLAKRKPKC